MKNHTHFLLRNGGIKIYLLQALFDVAYEWHLVWMLFQYLYLHLHFLVLGGYGYDYMGGEARIV